MYQGTIREGSAVEEGEGAMIRAGISGEYEPELAPAVTPNFLQPRILRAAWVATQGIGKLVGREPIPPSLELGLLGGLPGGDDCLGFGLGVLGGLLLGADVAFRPAIIAGPGQGGEHPRAWIGHGLAILVEHLAALKLPFGMVEALHDFIRGLAQFSQGGGDLVELLPTEAGTGKIRPGQGDAIGAKRDR